MLIKGYSDLSVKTPDCHVGVPVWIARFKLDSDVSKLFPYINAVAKDAVYYEKPDYIQFNIDGFKCALYPDNAAVAPFADREQAIKFIDRLIEFINDLDSRKDSIEPDHRKHRYIPILDIFKLLPKTNCQDCGFLSCMAFATALSRGETVQDKCPDFKSFGD